MTITIAPWLLETIELLTVFSFGWAWGAFVRWFNKETRN